MKVRVIKRKKNKKETNFNTKYKKVIVIITRNLKGEKVSALLSQYLAIPTDI